MSNVCVIGGGAAGFFSALTSAGNGNNVTILEKTGNLLSKVKISGGGRCNITNSETDINSFVKNYPRGIRELVSVFNRFNSSDTVNWFEQRGLKLKTENGGRMFPVTDSSESVIDLFLRESKKHGLKILTSISVRKIHRDSDGIFIINDDDDLIFDKIIACAGGYSNPENYKWLSELGHSIINPVPSLFTFNCSSPFLKDLQGISVDNAEIKVKGTKLVSEGALLITHRGFSGPAVLKLSAFGARLMNEMNYNFEIEIIWTQKDVQKVLNFLKEKFRINTISGTVFRGIPARLWERIIETAGIDSDKKWNDFSKQDLRNLENILTKSVFKITGRDAFKEEFVTAGGIKLKEVDFRTMESKICKGLYFAGEVLDIDGLTGGFNFQSAWSTGYIAGINT
jgi:predicted Rossmann fold flavoprotein